VVVCEEEAEVCVVVNGGLVVCVLSQGRWVVRREGVCPMPVFRFGSERVYVLGGARSPLPRQAKVPPVDGAGVCGRCIAL